jgi:hypothetical protein
MNFQPDPDLIPWFGCGPFVPTPPLDKAEDGSTDLFLEIEPPVGLDLSLISFGLVRETSDGSIPFAFSPLGSGVSDGRPIRISRTVTGIEAKAFSPLIVNGSNHQIIATLESYTTVAR